MSKPASFERIELAGFRSGNDILVPVTLTSVERPKQIAMWNYRVRRWQRRGA